jgi:hypothetical protein
MFDQIAKQLEAQPLRKSNRYHYITQKEFEDFCKGFLFEEIKGNTKLGEAFCKKFGETNPVLSILSNKAATEHIKTFYVK